MTNKQAQPQPEPQRYNSTLWYRRAGAKYGSGAMSGDTTYSGTYRELCHSTHYILGIGEHIVIEETSISAVCPDCDGANGHSVGKRVKRWVPCKTCHGQGLLWTRQIDPIEIMMQPDPGSKWA